MATIQIDILGGSGEPFTPRGELYPKGIPSGESFGSESAHNEVDPTGIASSSAFGSPVVTEPSPQTISPTGIASSEAFGSDVVHNQVNGTGITSGQAFGSDSVTNEIDTHGISSSEAFGTPSVVILNTVQPAGISSSESFGPDVVHNEIDATGISSGEAFGSASVQLKIQPTGVPSFELFGSDAVTNEVDPFGIPSSEAFGIVSIPTIRPFGIPSDEAFGDTNVELEVLPLGIISREAFGLPDMGGPKTIFPHGISSLELFGQPVIQGKFGRITPTEGPTSGAQKVSVLSPGIEMANSEDRFTSPTLRSDLWTFTSSGSGSLTILPSQPRGILQLSTGMTPSSTSYIRFATPAQKFDIGVDVNLPVIGLRTGSGLVSFSVGAYISSSTLFRASIEITRNSEVLHVLSIENGQTKVDVSLPIQRVQAFNLRLLRVQEQVYVFLSGSLISVFPWTNLSASGEIGVLNDSSGTSNLIAAIAKYTRNPVIMFDTEVMKEVLFKSQGRLDGLTPPVKLPETVEILVATDTSEFPLDNTYAYFEPINYRRVGVAGTTTLVSISDPKVRNG